MANVFKPKRSNVPSSVPTTGQLDDGELAVNSADKKIFLRDGASVVEVANFSTGGSGTEYWTQTDVGIHTLSNVGIGTTNPTSRLDVVGDVRISGIVTASGGFNLGISSSGTTITSGPVTTLNFIGVGNTFSINGTTINISTPGVATTTAAGLQPASGYGTISYAAQVTLDFAASDKTMNTISLTGALELLSSNLANGREVRLRLVCDATQRTLTFPVDWKFVGTKPANITASKVAILSLAAFGTTNADVVAAYAVQL